MTEATKTRGSSKATRAKRPNRIPMSGSRKRMHIPDEYKDSAYHYAWITDRNDLVFRAKRAGYEHVQVAEMPELQVDVDQATNPDGLIMMNVGGGDVGYLMKQPMEFYEEDRQAQRELNEARVADIKRDLNSKEDGRYGKVEFE
jgi:hypothetical protein